MPFSVANAPTLVQELINKILYILRCRPLLQEVLSRRAETEAHMDDVSRGSNLQEDHILLLQEFPVVCQENHCCIKLKQREFMQAEMQYLGFNVGYGWWKAASPSMQPLQDMQIRAAPRRFYTTLGVLPAPYT